MTLTLVLFAWVPAVGASSDDVQMVHFAAAAADSYDHSGGGGAYVDFAGSTHTQSLTGLAFACDDVVSFFDVVTMTADAPSTAQTLEITNAFQASAGGVGFTDIMNIAIDASDPGQANDGGSKVGVVGFGVDQDGQEPFFDDGTVLSGETDMLFVTYVVDDLETAETVVVRVDVKLECAAGSEPTGDLTTSLVSSGIVAEGGTGVAFDAAGSPQTVVLSSVASVKAAGTASGGTTTAAGGDSGEAVDPVETPTAVPGASTSEPPSELPKTGAGSNLAATLALAVVGAGMIVLGSSYRRGVGV